MEPLTADETVAELEMIEHTGSLFKGMRGQFPEAHAAQLAATQRGDGT